MVSRSIEQAQKKIEGLHFDSRKQVLEYDDIMNRQREVIYKKRRAWLEPSANLRDEIMDVVKAEVASTVQAYFASETGELKDLVEKLNTVFPVRADDAAKIAELNEQAGDEIFAITDFAQKLAEDRYVEKEHFAAGQAKQLSQPANVSSSIQQPDDFSLVRQIERTVALQNLDTIWMEHLDTMEHLRESVGLRGYGQRDPLVEYKREGFDLFKRALVEIDKGIVYAIYKVGIVIQPQATQIQQAAIAAAQEQSSGGAAGGGEKVGRNDPCPCGSGRKYKKCGMLNTPEHQANVANKNS
jgi:preprotein translocase subunit SecA